MKVAEARFSTPEAFDPSWQKWVDLVQLGVAESQDPMWAECIHLASSRPAEAALLHGASFRIAAANLTTLVRRLADEVGIVNVDRLDPRSLILTGVERDAETIDTLANRVAVPADTIAIVAQLAALPILLNAAKMLDPEASRTWQRGYCPVCGAWPALAEMRGIQRERRLRCGCCGSDWILPVLRCAFCDEIDHTRLGTLLTEEGSQQVRVETCSSCHGYLKTLSTLSILPFITLVTRDLSTVAFDVAARDRGYARPAAPGWHLQVEIVQ